jgi:hypothetical protein
MNPSEIEQTRLKYVRVTNGLDFPFTDRYDGVPITIPPGKSENLPLDMAAHIFGYQYGIDPMAMFRYIAKRQGWNTPEHVKQNPDTQKTLAQEYFEKLKIEAVTYRLVPDDAPDPRKPVPAEQSIQSDDEEPVRRAPVKRKPNSEATA